MAVRTLNRTQRKTDPTTACPGVVDRPIHQLTLILDETNPN